MILAIINLLTNAIRHSGLDLNVDIYISASALTNGYKIKICNTLSEMRIPELNESFFVAINTSLNRPESLELLRQEGGTGIAKAFHHLKSAHPGFDLKVSLVDRKFCTEVSYVAIDIAS
jgi:signal transduction histidine kinase